MEKNTAAEMLSCPMPDCVDGIVGTGRLPSGMITVSCGRCVVSVAGDTTSEAISKWNKLPRASHPAPQAAAEGVGSIADEKEFRRLLTLLHEACYDQYSKVEPMAVRQVQGLIIKHIDNRAAQEQAASCSAPDAEAIRSAAPVEPWNERMGVKVGQLVYPGEAFPFMKEEILEWRALSKSSPAVKSAEPTLMRQAVATVVSRVGDDLRVGWLRPERCDVGTLLYCAAMSAGDAKGASDDRG